MTEREKQFVINYCNCWNGAKAARQSGYSAASARQIASELLTKPYIREAINKRLAEMKVSQDEIFARLGQMSRGELPTKITKSGSVEKKEYDALSASEKVGKVYAMFVDKLQLDIDGIELVDVDMDDDE